MATPLEWATLGVVSTGFCYLIAPYPQFIVTKRPDAISNDCQMSDLDIFGMR